MYVCVLLPGEGDIGQLVANVSTVAFVGIVGVYRRYSGQDGSSGANATASSKVTVATAAAAVGSFFGDKFGCIVVHVFDGDPNEEFVFVRRVILLLLTLDICLVGFETLDSQCVFAAAGRFAVQPKKWSKKNFTAKKKLFFKFCESECKDIYSTMYCCQ